MLHRPTNGASAIPSRCCLQVLRSLALNNNGGPTAAESNYSTDASVAFACRIPREAYTLKRALHGQKRTFRSSAYCHDATLSARKLAWRAPFMEEDDMLSYSGRGRSHEDFAEEEQSTRGAEKLGKEHKELMEKLKGLQELLDEERPIEAAQLFLERHPPSLRGISLEQREMAEQIFFANCRMNSPLIARNVFDRLNMVDGVSRLMWRTLLIAMAQKGYIESVATLYLRYRDTYSLPPELVDTILRTLIETRRLSIARSLLYENLKNDRRCGLVGTFLMGIWKRTRNAGLLESQVREILSLLEHHGKKPTSKLFNPVIEAYIELGKSAEVDALVEDMQTHYGIHLNCRTRGLLVFQQALCCEWDTVKHGLDAMHADGMTQNKHGFALVFDRVFLEYYVSHSARDIRNFVVRAVEEYGLTPDKVLYEHILQAYVEKGNTAMVDEFTQMARDRSWKIDFTEQDLLNLLQNRLLALNYSPVGSWETLRAARTKYGQATTSQRILGYDRNSFPIEEAYRMPGTGEMMPWYQRTLQVAGRSTPRWIDHYQTLELQMAHFMHVGRLDSALRSFNRAKGVGFDLKQVHYELATIATLLLDGIGAAKSIVLENLRDLAGDGQLPPIFLYQILKVDDKDEMELMKLGIFRFYHLCWENLQLGVKHHLLVSTSRRLILHDQPDRAQELLTSVYKSRFRYIVPFDGVCMKMFMRAFEAQTNLHGIRWCLMSCLGRNSALNREVVVEARRVMTALKSKFPELQEPRNPRSRISKSKRYRFNDIVDKVTFLSHVTELLEKKSMGQLKGAQYHVKAQVKNYMRFVEANWRRSDTFQFNWRKIKIMMRRWDEEQELSILLREVEYDERRIIALFNEERVLKDARGTTNLDDEEEEAEETFSYAKGPGQRRSGRLRYINEENMDEGEVLQMYEQGDV